MDEQVKRLSERVAVWPVLVFVVLLMCSFLTMHWAFAAETPKVDPAKPPTAVELQDIVKARDAKIQWLEAKVAELQKLNEGLTRYFQASQALSALEQNKPPEVVKK